MFISRAWFFCFIDRHVDNRKPNLCFVFKVPDKASQNTKQDPLDKYFNRKNPGTYLYQCLTCPGVSITLVISGH